MNFKILRVSCNNFIYIFLNKYIHGGMISVQQTNIATILMSDCGLEHMPAGGDPSATRNEP